MLTREDVEITVTCEPEIDGPEGHFSSGDDEQDAADCKAIREALEYNEWAWCIIGVTVEWNGVSETEYLGGCNYDSKEQFIEAGDYYDDLVNGTLSRLNDRIAKIVADYAEING